MKFEDACVDQIVYSSLEPNFFSISHLKLTVVNRLPAVTAEPPRVGSRVTPLPRTHHDTAPRPTPYLRCATCPFGQPSSNRRSAVKHFGVPDVFFRPPATAPYLSVFQRRRSHLLPVKSSPSIVPDVPSNPSCLSSFFW